MPVTEPYLDGLLDMRLSLAARCTRGLQVTLALQNRGRRECRMRAAPAVSCAICTRRCAHEHTGQRRQSDIPCAMVLRLISRSSRRSGFFVTVTPEKLASHELDASVEASEPHDFAVRFGAARQKRCRVHRIPPQ